MQFLKKKKLSYVYIDFQQNFIQDLSSRPHLPTLDTRIQVCVFIFDLMYLNGVSYISHPLQTRRSLIQSHIHFTPRQIEMVEHINIEIETSTEKIEHINTEVFCDETINGDAENEQSGALLGKNDQDFPTSSENLESFFHKALEKGCEGLIVKSLGEVFIFSFYISFYCDQFKFYLTKFCFPFLFSYIRFLHTNQIKEAIVG